MNNKELVLSVHYNMGRTDAQTLRDKAAGGEVTDTEIIASEHAVPLWDGKKDYGKAAIGAPVLHDGQVYGLLQPHNASHYVGTPATLTALWRVKHTTDPDKAKPWVKPTSTSDMYLVGECMIWADGITYKAVRDTIYSPDEYADDWEAAE